MNYLQKKLVKSYVCLFGDFFKICSSNHQWIKLFHILTKKTAIVNFREEVVVWNISYQYHFTVFLVHWNGLGLGMFRSLIFNGIFNLNFGIGFRPFSWSLSLKTDRKMTPVAMIWNQKFWGLIFLKNLLHMVYFL